MKLRLLVLLVCVFSFTAVINAQAPTKEDSAKEKSRLEEKQKAVADYNEALAKLKKGDLKIDFVKFRLDYTETEDYSPYGGGTQRRNVITALKAKKYKDAVKAADVLLETNYCDLNGHYLASIAHKELDNKEKETYHKNVLKGLLDAILLNDGLTADTAMTSIGISEQYFIMSILGFQQQSKSLIRENGSMFDVHTAYNEESKETRKFWFNIDKVFGRF